MQISFTQTVETPGANSFWNQLLLLAILGDPQTSSIYMILNLSYFIKTGVPKPMEKHLFQASFAHARLHGISKTAGWVAQSGFSGRCGVLSTWGFPMFSNPVGVPQSSSKSLDPHVIRNPCCLHMMAIGSTWFNQYLGSCLSWLLRWPGHRSEPLDLFKDTPWQQTTAKPCHPVIPYRTPKRSNFRSPLKICWWSFKMF